MNITLFYNLGLTQPEIEFIDVNLQTDNLLFIDPRLIESVKSNGYISEMRDIIEIFWGELIKSVRTNDKSKTTSLLSGLSEPNETRLGYAHTNLKRDPQGNSVGPKLKPKIVSAIITNKAVRTGILSHFGDAELFIPDISCDRISDITTKVVKATLIKFTQQQCELLKIPMKKVRQKDIFNPNTLKWEKKDVNLPVYSNGKPIIFVPKEIVRLENSASSNVSCFYRYAIRKFIKYDKDLLKEVNGSGKNKEIQLCDIKNEFPLSKDKLVDWSLRHPKLLVDYKTDKLNSKLKPLSDEEIESIVYKDSHKRAS
jgi:hypothetical protein